MTKLAELSEKTATLWLANGSIEIDSVGEENTYYTDEFDNRFYCKNYPDPLSQRVLTVRQRVLLAAA